MNATLSDDDGLPKAMDIQIPLAQNDRSFFGSCEGPASCLVNNEQKSNNA